MCQVTHFLYLLFTMQSRDSSIHVGAWLEFSVNFLLLLFLHSTAVAHLNIAELDVDVFFVHADFFPQVPD